MVDNDASSGWIVPSPSGNTSSYLSSRVLTDRNGADGVPVELDVPYPRE